MRKLKNYNWNTTQELKSWQNFKTQVVTKLKFVTKLKYFGANNSTTWWDELIGTFCNLAMFLYFSWGSKYCDLLVLVSPFLASSSWIGNPHFLLGHLVGFSHNIQGIQCVFVSFQIYKIKHLERKEEIIFINLLTLSIFNNLIKDHFSWNVFCFCR